jgi:hypothetical protein
LTNEPGKPPIAVAADPPMTTRDTILLIGYNIACLAIPALVLFLAYAWPKRWVLTGDGRSMLLAMLIGMAMGAVHSLASISAHAGKHDLGASWRTFYVCRPFIGGGMALVTCLILVGGLGGFSVTDVPVKRELVLLAWAALAGLYSQPALEKIKELFATIFAITRKARAIDDPGQHRAK